MGRKKRIVFENDRTVLQPVQFLDAGEKAKAIKVPDIDNLDEMSSYRSLRKSRFKRACVRVCVWLALMILLPVMVFLGVMVFSAPDTGHNFFGYTFYLVTANSMVPDIEPGDMIIDKTNFTIDDIKVGTDITFLRESDGKIVTHRVKSFEDTESGRVYTTHGINTTFDDAPVNFNNVLGIKCRVASALGDIVVFFRSTFGMIVMFSMFALILAGIYFSFAYSNHIKAVGK